MLRVDSSKTCKVVYSLCKHEYLGYLIEPHIVQLNPQGDFSFTYQRIFTHTAEEFAACLTEIDYKLIKILDDIEQDSVIKKYYKKLIRPTEFFTKIFDHSHLAVVRGDRVAQPAFFDEKHLLLFRNGVLTLTQPLKLSN